MAKRKGRTFTRLTKAQRKLAGPLIAKHMRHVERHPGGRKQVIVIGLKEASRS